MTAPQDAPERGRETFIRPNGKPYRPRKGGMTAHSWQNDWGTEDRGCVITGTLDPERSRTFARRMVDFWHSADDVDMPQVGWWRLAMRDGDRQWVNDPERGRPGVMWTAVYS